MVAKQSSLMLTSTGFVPSLFTDVALWPCCEMCHCSFRCSHRQARLFGWVEEEELKASFGHMLLFPCPGHRSWTYDENHWFCSVFICAPLPPAPLWYTHAYVPAQLMFSSCLPLPVLGSDVRGHAVWASRQPGAICAGPSSRLHTHQGVELSG